MKVWGLVKSITIWQNTLKDHGIQSINSRVQLLLGAKQLTIKGEDIMVECTTKWEVEAKKKTGNSGIFYIKIQTFC